MEEPIKRKCFRPWVLSLPMFNSVQQALKDFPDYSNTVKPAQEVTCLKRPLFPCQKGEILIQVSMAIRTRNYI